MRREKAAGCPSATAVWDRISGVLLAFAAASTSFMWHGHVDHDAQPVAFGDGIASERRQTS